MEQFFWTDLDVIGNGQLAGWNVMEKNVHSIWGASSDMLELGRWLIMEQQFPASGVFMILNLNS